MSFFSFIFGDDPPETKSSLVDQRGGIGYQIVVEGGALIRGIAPVLPIVGETISHQGSDYTIYWRGWRIESTGLICDLAAKRKA